MATYGSRAAATALDALGDPTRRSVVELLRDGERSVGDLASDLPVSRPAVSQHLKVLKGAGLVTERREGTRHLYAIDPSGLLSLRSYLESFWDEALASFKEAADRPSDPLGAARAEPGAERRAERREGRRSR